MIRFYGSRLPLSQQKVYETLANGMIKLEEKIDFPPSAYKAIGNIIDAITLDFPELFYLNSFEYFTDGATKAWLEPKYTYPKMQALQVRSRVSAAVRTICAKVTGNDTRSRLLCLHDLIAAKVTYTKSGQDVHSVVGAALQNKAVCEGIAKLFLYCCNSLGLECCLVTGKARGDAESDRLEPHAWNKVKIDGDWVNVDVTFDLPQGDEKVGRSYLFLSDKAFSRNHGEKLPVLAPCRTDRWGYYEYERLTVASFAEVQKLLTESFRQKKYEVAFKSTFGALDENSLLNLANDVLQRLRIFSAWSVGLRPNHAVQVYGIQVKNTR